ncbi:cysteine dioxygenase family protein [Sandarakinorhabdus oryzae]|uniref:cysteine dioxygenase family protein n=1 Tax=Sandarakinorhabdus oryzae TaxID=2675220 RepID=UPI0012E22CAF|nr:cysteine dioxygenase [Sandarakinorhabdus oryzae]
MTTPPEPLARFIAEVRQALATPAPLAMVSAALARLVARDDWLPPAYAQPHPEHYQQYLLHADPAGRFSIVSFVWGPGQATPIHDHGVWGAVGVLRGAEQAQAYTADGAAPPRALGEPATLYAGDVEQVGPEVGDIHKVANASPAVSVSIHVYGTDIGRHPRHVYPAEGGLKPFISGYANGPDTPAFSAA